MADLVETSSLNLQSPFALVIFNWKIFPLYKLKISLSKRLYSLASRYEWPQMFLPDFNGIKPAVLNRDNWPVTKSLFYLHSQQPFACGVGSCQNGGTCLEQCDGNRKCICTDGYTGAHCENSLTKETLRKKHNKNLSMYIIIYRQYLN